MRPVSRTIATMRDRNLSNHNSRNAKASQNQAQMPALFARDTNVPTTMSGQNPFQSPNATAASTGQENQTHEAEQHKQVKAAVDKRYVWQNCDRRRRSILCEIRWMQNCCDRIEDMYLLSSSNPLYVSPSDAIMSPASQKLSSFKQRQINKQ